MGFKKKYKTLEEPCLSLLNSQSSFELKEAYNTLATKVIYFPIEDTCKKIVITSSNYGEGKTSVAINLAIALASSLIDKKVLLVDADLRSPHVKTFLNSLISNEENNSGLSDYLSVETAKCKTYTTHIDNLHVIYSGDAPINPAGLINSDKMNELMSSFEGKYDYVIIDTPPVNVVSDSILLVGRVNGYVIASKAGYTTVPMLNSAAESLNMVGANVFGVVLSESN